jgi:hypothetical protein
VYAHVGADFDGDSWEGLRVGEELEQDLDFPLATLAVAEEGLAHVDVVGVDEHEAVAGLRELVGWGDWSW